MAEKLFYTAMTKSEYDDYVNTHGKTPTQGPVGGLDYDDSTERMSDFGPSASDDINATISRYDSVEDLLPIPDQFDS